jgi:hypothetical protein
MALPNQFQTQSSAPLANYSYIDIAEGTGVIEFYGLRVSVDATAANDDYKLVTNAIISSASQTELTSDGQEILFDVVFNLPKVVKGDVYVVVPLTHVGAGTGVAAVGIDKVSGADTTALLAYTNLPSITGDSSQDKSFTATIALTKFKRGDTLRLKIKRISNGGGNFYLNHNPIATTAALTNSGGRLSFYVPFRIEL